MSTIKLTPLQVDAWKILNKGQMEDLRLIALHMKGKDLRVSELWLGTIRLISSGPFTGDDLYACVEQFRQKTPEEILHGQEKEALGKLIDALKEEGWSPLSVDDGGDEDIAVAGWETTKVVEDLAAVDESTLRLQGALKDGRTVQRTLLIVWGNSVPELIADSSWCEEFNQALDKAQKKAGMEDD